MKNVQPFETSELKAELERSLGYGHPQLSTIPITYLREPFFFLRPIDSESEIMILYGLLEGKIGLGHRVRGRSYYLESTLSAAAVRLAAAA